MDPRLLVLRITGMINIGNLALGTRPHLVAAMTDRTSADEARAAVDAGVDLLELRIDQFSSRDSEHVVKVVRTLAGLPLLCTIRHAIEGGAWEQGEAERLDLYLRLLPYVDAVDVELMAKEVLLPLVDAAHAAGKVVIGSHHNFKTTPLPEKLAGVANDGKLLGVDIVKIAAHCQSQADVRALASFTLAHASKQLVVIGMGPHGKMTRLFFPGLGSLLTYTFLGEATAPGQLTCGESIQYLRDFYPDMLPAEEEALTE